MPPENVSAQTIRHACDGAEMLAPRAAHQAGGNSPLLRGDSAVNSPEQVKKLHMDRVCAGWSRRNESDRKTRSSLWRCEQCACR